MGRIYYQIENRDALFAQLAAEGKVVVSDTTINLDENGRLTDCSCEVIDAPPAQDPTYEELLEAYNIATGGVT